MKLKLRKETDRVNTVVEVSTDSPIGRMFLNSTTMVVEIVNHLGERTTYRRQFVCPTQELFDSLYQAGDV